MSSELGIHRTAWARGAQVLGMLLQIPLYLRRPVDQGHAPPKERIQLGQVPQPPRELGEKFCVLNLSKAQGEREK